MLWGELYECCVFQVWFFVVTFFRCFYYYYFFNPKLDSIFKTSYQMISYLLVRKNYGRGPPYDVFETVVMKFICRNFRKKKYSDRSRGEKL